MKTWLRSIAGTMLIGALAVPAGLGQVEQQLAIIDEKLDKLRAEVEALQFKQQQTEKQLEDLQAQINHLRKADGGVAAADVQALDARIRAVDAAREKDKQVILDTLAKELAQLAGTRAGTSAATGGEHVVQKGETLSTIAKQHGISADALAKANNLANPNALQIGQKLVIPK